MRALLRAGGSPNQKDRDGNTPLHVAAGAPGPTLHVSDLIALVCPLLKVGTDPGKTNGGGSTALHVAARGHDSPDGVAALLSGCANANPRDRRGNTALHIALDPGPGWPGMVQALLSGSNNPTTTDGNGHTALQRFVRAGSDRGDTATVLIGAGADPDLTCPNGNAPLRAPIREGGNRGKVEVAEALLAGGADPRIRDARGFIPCSVACDGGVIHRALDYADGHELACHKKWEHVAAGASRMMRARTRITVRSGSGTQCDRETVQSCCFSLPRTSICPSGAFCRWSSVSASSRGGRPTSRSRNFWRSRWGLPVLCRRST